MDKPRQGSLAVIFLTVFIDLLGFGIVLPLLPVYADSFIEDDSGIRLGLLMASFSAMQFLFAPIWGRISDRIGRRPVIMVGLLGSVIFYTVFGMATVAKSIFWLFVARIGAGISGATISTAQAYIADTTSLENRPRGMALIGMAFGLGFTFGPLVGYLAVPSGTGDPGPMPGYAAAGLSLVALLFAFFRLPESLRPGSESAERRLLDWAELARAVQIPSIALLLLSTFICVFSFANFETTLSLTIKGSQHHGEDAAGELPAGEESIAVANEREVDAGTPSVGAREKERVAVSLRTSRQPFAFSFRQVCLTYAYIGIVLALVQGGLVRRMAGKVSEVRMASGGALGQIVGFALVILAVNRAHPGLLFGGLTLIVAGFAFMTPSLNSLVSRRSDPARQGGILGLNQSFSSLARILGPPVGIPLLKISPPLPFFTAAGLMLLGLCLILQVGRKGGDYPAD
jgi:MFS family permease